MGEIRPGDRRAGTIWETSVLSAQFCCDLNCSKKLPLKKSKARLPWWLSGKESTCQYRRHGFSL